MYLFDFIWECLINFMEIILFFIFIRAKLHSSTRKQYVFQKQLFFLLIQFIALCTLNHSNVNSLLTISFICLADVIFALLFYENSIIIRIFWSLMFSVICMLAEYITIFIPQTFANIDSLEILIGGTLRVPFTLLYIALITVFVFIFYCITDKDIVLSAFQKVTHIIISIIGIMFGHYIMLTTLDSEKLFHNQAFSFRLMLINLFFILLFLVLLIYIYQLGYSNNQNKKLMEEKKLKELEEMEYENLIKTTASLREMKHDIEIHLNVIQSLAANNNFDELISYIESYHDTLEDTHHLLSTGNTAIDCILSSKIAIAKKAGIQTDFSVMLPQHLPLDTLSISSLLGNLWNNALEANQRMIKESNKIKAYIKFFIKPFQGMVIIHIENSFNGVLRLAPDKSFLSIKNAHNHGIGLTRIQTIVKQANGILKINTENHIFSVHILLPQKEQ